MLNILLYIWNQKDFELNQICYNPKLSSDFNLDKDLNKEQLVKCKNTGLYLQLYISNNYEKVKRCPCRNNKEGVRKTWWGLYSYMRKM